MAELSDLESVVLGLVWKRGPCTPYAIRREFLGSPAPHFSGSAGAIYPLVRRLEADGLLASQASRQGRRRSRVYAVTRSGAAALKRWLQPPVPDDDASVTFDPLRARVYFLEALPAASRRTFLDESIRALQARLPRLEADERRYEETGDSFSHLAARGMILTQQARIDWLRHVRRRLKSMS